MRENARRPWMSRQIRIALEKPPRRAARLVEYLHVPGQTRKTQSRKSVLARAKNIARPPHCQVFFGKNEAVVRLD